MNASGRIARPLLNLALAERKYPKLARDTKKRMEEQKAGRPKQTQELEKLCPANYEAVRTGRRKKNLHR